MVKFFLTTLFILSILVLGSYQYAQAQIQDCPLDIVKSANPADDTDFEFVLTGNADDSFILQDPSDPVESITVPSETAGIVITETVPLGWVVTDIVCQGDVGFSFNQIGNNAVVASCEVIGNAPPSGQCTFFNVQSQGVPAMSRFSMIAFAVVLGIAGLIHYRRKILTA